MTCLFLLWTSLLVAWSLYDILGCKESFDCTSFPWIVCSLAVRVHVSHTHRNIDTSDRISLILDRRVMFLSFHIGFSLVIAAVVWAILEIISGLDPSSLITEPRYLNLDTVSNHCPFTVIFLLMPLVLLVISLVFSFLSLFTNFHSVGRRCIVEAAH